MNGDMRVSRTAGICDAAYGVNQLLLDAVEAVAGFDLFNLLWATVDVMCALW